MLLIPALVLALLAPVITEYDTLWKRQERLPVQVAQGQWATYAGVRIRLVEVSEAKDLPGYAGQRRPAPAGVRVVRVVLAFDGPGAALDRCNVTLLSTTGDEYDARPDELGSASLGYYPCSFQDAIEPTTSPSPAGSGTSASPAPTKTGPTKTAASTSVTPSTDPSGVQQWRTETYFVMPLYAYPGKVHLSLSTELPSYLIFN